MASDTRRFGGARTALAALALLLVAGTLTGCPIPDCCAPETVLETLAPTRDAEVWPLGADVSSPTARVGRVAGQPVQMVVEFYSILAGGGGTYVDAATLSFFLESGIGAPEVEFGDLRVELVDNPIGGGSGLGDPLSGADFDDGDTASFRVTGIAATPAGRLVSVDVRDAVAGATSPSLAFRITFPPHAAGGPDAYVGIATSRSAALPAPALVVDGGILGH